MAQTAQKPMTIDEFLDWQSLQDKNYELVDGIPVLPLKSMTGATQRHDRIVVNFLADEQIRLMLMYPLDNLDLPG